MVEINSYQIREFFGNLEILFFLLLGAADRSTRDGQVPGLRFARIGNGRGHRGEDAGPVVGLVRRRQAGVNVIQLFFLRR